MPSRILPRSFVLLTVLLAVMGVLAAVILDRVMDEYVRSLVQNARLQLKTDIVGRMQTQGLLAWPEAPPPPDATPSESPSAVPDLGQKVLPLVLDTVSNYRLGQGGYAWLYDIQHGDWKVLRIDMGGVSAAQVDSDRKLLPDLIGANPADTLQWIDDQVPRYVAFTRVPQATDLVVGVSYPMSDVAPLLTQFRQDIALLFLWLLVIGVVVLWRITRRTDESVSALLSLSDLVAQHEEIPDTINVPGELEPVARMLVRLWRDLEQSKSQDVHRLTNLPSNNGLSAELFRRIDLGAPLAVGLVNATDFSAYNYKYGYAKGDSFLRFMATIVSNAVREAGQRDDFVAHLAGDHFVYVTSPEHADGVAQRIIHDFDELVGFYYTAEDRERGHMLSKDRRGDFRTFPIMQVTIGIATNERHPLLHPLQIGAICAEVVAYLNREKRSGFLRDRRVQDRDAAGPEPAEPNNSSVDQGPVASVDG